MSTGSRVAEPANAPGDLAALENTLKSATTAKPVAKDGAAPTNKNESGTKPEKPDWIQDKFWTGDVNESAAKQAQAYAPLQSAYGRMANDLGHQRKITDQLILGKRTSDLDGTQPTEPTVPKVDARQLVDNPTATLDAYWKQREADLLAREAEKQRLAQAQAEEQQFLGKHGDFQTVTSTAEFVNWVRSSPLRLRAAALAGQGNYVVADELLTEYKALSGQAPAPAGDPNRGADDAAAKEAARKAVLESAANGGTGAGKGGPVYRRADLIALKMNKPHVYSDPVFQREILQAYADGRVK